MEIVTSRSNPTIKLVRALLGRRSVRYREKLFVAEGPRAVTTLVDSGVPVHSLLLDAEHAQVIDDDALRSLVERSERVTLVDSALLRWVADTENPQPVLAVCGMPPPIVPGGSDLIVALDGVQDPGNLGTIIRTSVAAGVDWVALLPGTVDPFNPKVVRSTAGLVGALPLVRMPDIDEIVHAAGRYDLGFVLAAAEGDVRYDEVDWTRPSVLVLGGEAAGVRLESFPPSAIVASIPMASGVDSLNVGVAAGVLLFEAARQRRRDSRG